MRLNNKLYYLASGIILVFFWYILSLNFSPLVVPDPLVVFKKILSILSDQSLVNMIFITLKRLLIGLLIGISLGFLIGLLIAYKKGLKGLLSPIIGLCQVMPPVSWLVIALIWFGFNSKPAIFIIAISSFPVLALNVYEGCKNLDTKLLQMAKLYKISKARTLIDIIFPQIMPYFYSSFKIVLGSGFKIAVMAEVLTTSDGIGGMIKLGRLNIEQESIFAWSFIVVILFCIFNFFSDLIFLKTKEKFAQI